MLWCMNDFVRDTMDDDPTTQIYFEWTHPCYGWREPPMMDLATYMDENDFPWLPCRVDGCNYGMKNKHNTMFIKKKWLIYTTDEDFHKHFRAKVCPGGHNHATIEGDETSRTAYYPWKLVESIARVWRKQFITDKHVHGLFDDSYVHYDVHVDGDLLPVEDGVDFQPVPVPVQQVGDGQQQHSQPLQQDPGEPLPNPSEHAPLPDGVTQHEMDTWKSKVAHFHKAAGHPSNRNLAKIVKDTGQPDWKVQVVLQHKCQTCTALKPGGTSSGSIPPASTAPMYKAWQAIGIDASEWQIPGKTAKMKFLLIMDLATKLRAVYPVKEYENFTMDGESSKDIIAALGERWLSTYPKPEILVVDPSSTMVSATLREFCSNLSIFLQATPEKEPWSHGIVEAGVQDVKALATAIHMENLEQTPSISLVLATSALNSTEYTAGYSAFQWAFGRTYSISDEDVRTFHQVDQTTDFTNLVAARQQAEEVAVKTRSTRVLSKLANSTVRQPLRTFSPMDLVKVWRKYHPADQHRGARGGFKKSGRPHWIGPGRVIFQEVLPNQSEDDDRRHIIWVLIGTRVLRCSVHSVRAVTEVERIRHHLETKEDPSKWKTLADILPRREFEDITDQVPGPEDLELPDLPSAPNVTTYVPIRRARGKQTFGPEDWQEWRGVHRSSPIGVRLDSRESPPVHSYVPTLPAPGSPAPSMPYEPSTPARSSGHVSEPEVVIDLEPEDEGVNDYEAPQEPKEKQARKIYDLGWLEQLQCEAEQEPPFDHVYNAAMEAEEAILLSFEVAIESNKQKKMLERNPEAFMVKKMNNSEVSLGRLNAADKALFERAKSKEVSSFIRNQAVRQCLNDEEVQQAWGSGRILKARWILTWKSVSPDEAEEAKADARDNPQTVCRADGKKRAKARIVLLGYQHPSLLDRGFKTAAPVTSTLGRHMLYMVAAFHQWSPEGLDLATAFLQTQPTEADSMLWTTGVDELKDALGVSRSSVLRILRNIYGSTTAPRGLWLDLHNRLTAIGGVPALGERCLWLWFSKTERDSTNQFPRLIGAMGGHVDDFHRVGGRNSSKWCEVCQQIDRLYQ